VRRGGIVTSRHNTVWLLQLTGSEAPISNCDGPSHPSKHAENKEGTIFDFQEYNFCFSYLYYEDTRDLKKMHSVVAGLEIAGIVMLYRFYA